MLSLGCKSSNLIGWDKCPNQSNCWIHVQVTTLPVLAYPKFDKPFIVYTDASTIALGAILQQKDEDGIEHIITYASRTLYQHEKNYSITDLECLAVIWAIKHFHHYLHEQKFLIITDHSALTHLKNMANPVGRLGRWLMTLNGYDFEITNRSGKQHSNVDPLSRIQIK